MDCEPEIDKSDGRRLAGAETRARLLDAASEILAVAGEDGLTVRAISGLAGTNVAAVKYHFGSKEGLIAEVVERETQGIIDAQVAALKKLEASATPAGVEAWVTAWSRPLIHSATSSKPEARRLGRMIGQGYAAPLGEFDSSVRDAVSEPNERLLRGLEGALPELPRGDVLLRFALMVSALAGFASGTLDPFLTQAEPERDLQARILELLVATAKGSTSS